MTTQYFDSIIIGAGISGISAAYHLQTHNKQQSFTILERRDDLGGTWDLFNYPGIRSDSDMYTFGFSFRPWDDQSAIAKKHKIIEYLKNTTQEFKLDQHIQYGVHIINASWSSDTSRWQLTASNGELYSCQFIFMCSGYYNYDRAHDPAFEGLEKFQGEVLHPQFWPQDSHYQNKNVVIIGSGATAITLVPSLAEKAKKVTMLQRSPTYMGSKPSVDPWANFLAKWLGRWAARWWFILSTMFIYILCQMFPEAAKKKILRDIKSELGDKFDPKHFTPSYNPWDQRACLCPDGDFFEAIKSDKADVQTDTIAGFNANGIELSSGQHLDADIIVTATGLKIQFLGGIDFEIDGKPFVPNESYVYKGMMLSGVPNTFIAIGYTNASWTLKVDLSHRYANRLIRYMVDHDYSQTCPTSHQSLQDTALLDLSSGYIQRALDELPKQSTKKPWRVYQNYILDTLALRFSSVKNKYMHFK